MKQILVFILVAGILVLGYFIFDYYDRNGEVSISGMVQESKDKAKEKEEKKKEEEKKKNEPDLTGIPEEWINAFKFDNVTIQIRNFDTHYYKVIDGVIYMQTSDGYNKREDLHFQADYTLEYSSFTFDGGNTYTATNLTRHVDWDDSWPQDVTIKIYDGKVTHITVDSKLNSLTITTQYVLYDYGTTVLEEAPE